MTFLTTVTAMASQSPAPDYSYLMQEGREGVFALTAGDYSNTLIDQSQGIIVPLACSPLTSAYIRKTPDYLTPGFFGVPVGVISGDHTQAVKDMFWALAEGYGNKHLVIDRIVRLHDGVFIDSSFPDDVLIEGVNGGALIETTIAPTKAMLHFNNPAHGVKIRNVKFKQLSAINRAQGSTAIFMRAAGARISIEGCEISGVSYGIWIANGNTVTVRDCHIHEVFADGVHIGGGTQNFIIEGCKIYNTGDDMIGITTDGTDGNTTQRTGYGVIRGNILNNANGSSGNGVALYNVDHIIVGANEMNCMQGNGVSVHTSRADMPPPPIAGRCTNIKIQGNDIFGVGLAQVDPDGHSMAGEKGHGHGVYIDGGEHIETDGNTIKSIFASPNLWRSGICLNATTTALRNIICKNDTLVGGNGNALCGYGSAGADRITFYGTTISEFGSYATDFHTLYINGYATFKNMTAFDVAGNISLYLDAGSPSSRIDIVGNTFPSWQAVNLGSLAAANVRKGANFPAF